MQVSKFYEKSLAQLKQNLIADIYMMIRVYGASNMECTINGSFVIVEHKGIGWLTKIDDNHPVDMIAVENDHGIYRLEVGIDGVNYNIQDLDNLLIIAHILERCFKLVD